MKEIKPGTVCRVLPGGLHSWTLHSMVRDCAAGMIVVTETKDLDEPTFWRLMGCPRCSYGDFVICIDEKYLEPLIDPDVVKEYDERHKDKPKVVETHKLNGNWHKAQQK